TYERDECAAAPATDPAEGRQSPTGEQDQPERRQQVAERTGRREREGKALVAQDAVVGVQLGETIQRLPGRQRGSSPQRPEADDATPDQTDHQPAADVPPADPRAGD